MRTSRVRLSALRSLPVAIAVMAALLPIKVFTMLQAAGVPPAALASAGWAVVPTAQAASGHEHVSAVAPAAAKPMVAPPPVPVVLPAEPVIPDSERAVLLELRARRGIIEAREQAVSARETILAAAERRLTERVEQLTALQSRLEQLDAGRRERDETNWQSLVKTYEVMRPRDAAVILNDLETPVLLQVLDRMKESKAALVLAAMLPDRARGATAQLAQMRTRSVAPPDLAQGPQAVPSRSQR